MRLTGAQVTRVQEAMQRYDDIRRKSGHPFDGPFIPPHMATEDLVADILKIVQADART